MVTVTYQSNTRTYIEWVNKAGISVSNIPELLKDPPKLLNPPTPKEWGDLPRLGLAVSNCMSNNKLSMLSGFAELDAIRSERAGTPYLAESIGGEASCGVEPVEAGGPTGP